VYPVTVLLNVLGQLIVFLSELAVLLFSTVIDVDVHTVVLFIGQIDDDDDNQS